MTNVDNKKIVVKEKEISIMKVRGIDYISLTDLARFKDEERFDSYVRGGVDVLYEKLIEGASEPDDYVNKLYEFIEEFQDRFNSEISSDDIMQLCIKK